MVRKAPRTAFYFIQSAMTGFIASAFLSRNRVSLKEAFEGLELCEGKLSRTVLRGLDGSNPVRLLGNPRAIGSTTELSRAFSFNMPSSGSIQKGLTRLGSLGSAFNSLIVAIPVYSARPNLLRRRDLSERCSIKRGRSRCG